MLNFFPWQGLYSGESQHIVLAMSGLSIHLQLGNQAVLEEEQEHDLPLLVHHNEML